MPLQLTRLFRLVVVVVSMLLGLIVVSLTGPSASARERQGQCFGALGATDCGGTLYQYAPPSSISQNSLPTRQSTQIVNPLTIPELIPEDPGTLCVGFETVAQPTPPSAQQLDSLNSFTNGVLATYGLCPRTGVPAVVAVNPAVLAAHFWETIPLPAPKPSVPPGYAITGKPAYLVTNGQVAPPPFHQQTVVGALSISAKGSYEVSWGDGVVTGPYAAEGLPYPNGSIAHTYDNVGTYTVRVKETWTAKWHLGAAAGTLVQLHTQGVIGAFPVRQIQAVITG